MSFRLFVHPLARLDILDAVNCYEEQRPGLGLEMSDQVDAAIRRAADNPLAFAIIEGATRRFFEVDGDRLFVLAVTHVRRDPIAWRSRKMPGKPGRAPTGWS